MTMTCYPKPTIYIKCIYIVNSVEFHLILLDWETIIVLQHEHHFLLWLWLWLFWTALGAADKFVNVIRKIKFHFDGLMQI